MARTDLLSRRREMTGSWPARKAGKPKVDWRSCSGKVVDGTARVAVLMPGRVWGMFGWCQLKIAARLVYARGEGRNCGAIAGAIALVARIASFALTPTLSRVQEREEGVTF